MTPKFNALNAPPTAGKRGGRGSGRWMNPKDFEEKYGYDYTDDPNFDSQSDAGGIRPAVTGIKDPDTGIMTLEEDSPTRPTQLSSEGEGGGGVGRIGGTIGKKSRRQMSTGNISGTILSPNPKKVVA